MSSTARIEPKGNVVRISGSGGSADPDLPLIEQLAAGELEALRELYERHKAMAYGIALRITGDGATAEDAVQDAFLGAWRNAGRFVTGRASVRTWLLTIVHRRAIDAVRRRRPDSSIDTDHGATETMTLPDVWDEVSARVDRTTVKAAMSVISPVQRQAIELAYFEGLTQSEIATRTGVPLGTVKGRLRLGMLGLRRELTGGESERG